MIEEKLNLTYYCGEDLYSDGDVEDELLEAARQKEKIPQMLRQGDSWPHLYHLSNVRENLLDWYEFDKAGTLLEIGAGCGALTGLFCKKVSHVTAIDLSKKRSTINATRNEACDNLEIYVGNFEDIRLEEKFDYVTLIGVFEYSIYYVNSQNPFMDMLAKAKAFLKPGGKLIIAIEKKYGHGPHYGSSGFHQNIHLCGLLLHLQNISFRTFSRDTIDGMLRRAGFAGNEFYYPMPDYKLPNEIYSDSYLPQAGDLRNTMMAYDRDRYIFFDETKAFDAVCQDGLFPQFANSFLIISSL